MRPSRRERVDLVPELAPRLGIDAGGRLVEQQQLRIRAACRRRARAAASSRRTASRRSGSARPSRPSRSIISRAALGRLRQAVDARDELQVLAHRKILIEAEALRHVADLALDLVGLGADVVAETGAACPESGVSRPHSMRIVVVLPEPFGPEEAVDRAALDLQRQVAHHHAAVEAFGQAVDVDHDVGRRAHRFGSGRRHIADVTVTGWPTRSFSGVSVRASIRNTSLERSSWL